MKRKVSCRVCGYEEIFDGCGWSMEPLICCEQVKGKGKTHARRRHK